MKEKTKHIIEILFLIFFIILNILDFLHLLPGDVDYMKKILSWTLLGYLFYKVDFSRVLFGHSNHDVNLLIIISYLILGFKKFVASVIAISEESVFMAKTFEIIAENAFQIEYFSFVMGGVSLLALSCYMALKYDVGKRSLMGVIQEYGKPPKKWSLILLRFLTIFIVLSSFFIMLFDPAIEWLAIVVDAPLVVLALIVYLFVLVRHHKKHAVESFLYKVGNVGEEFYESFIEMFHYKEKIMIAFAGILVLHLLADISSFILPFVIPFFRPLYYFFMGANTHNSIYYWISSDIQAGVSPILAVFPYIISTLGMIMLLIVPALIWYRLFKQKSLEKSAFTIALFISSISSMVYSGLFTLSQIETPGFVGVDIQTQAIVDYSGTLILFAIIFVLAYVMSLYMRKIAMMLLFVSTDIFLGLYTFHFFSSTVKYYVTSIHNMFTGRIYFAALFFMLFLTIIVIFYVAGFFTFVWITKKEYLISSRKSR